LINEKIRLTLLAVVSVSHKNKTCFK